MKNILYILAIVLGVLGFIIALQNIPNTGLTQIFFQELNGSLFGPLILSQILGTLSGIAMGVGFMVRKKKEYGDVGEV